MMDVKDTINGSAASITSMLGRAAVEKNHEQKVLMEKPIREEIREEEPKKISSAEELSNKSTNDKTDEDISQLMPTTGKMVDVNV
jgi:hypothetical protein